MTWPRKTHDANGKPLTAKKLDALARNRASQAESRKRQRLSRPDPEPRTTQKRSPTRRALTAPSSSPPKLPDSPQDERSSKASSSTSASDESTSALPSLDPPTRTSSEADPNANPTRRDGACAAGGGTLDTAFDVGGKQREEFERFMEEWAEENREEAARETGLSSSPELKHKSLDELESSVKVLAERGPLQFPLPTNSICHTGHNVFRLHALAAARQRGFTLILGQESSYGSFRLNCTGGTGVRTGTDHWGCPFGMEVRRTGDGWRCTEIFGRHLGHKVHTEDGEGNMVFLSAGNAPATPPEPSSPVASQRQLPKRTHAEEDAPVGARPPP